MTDQTGETTTLDSPPPSHAAPTAVAVPWVLSSYVLIVRLLVLVTWVLGLASLVVLGGRALGRTPLWSREAATTLVLVLVSARMLKSIV